MGPAMREKMLFETAVKALKTSFGGNRNESGLSCWMEYNERRQRRLGQVCLESV